MHMVNVNNHHLTTNEPSFLSFKTAGRQMETLIFKEIKSTERISELAVVVLLKLIIPSYKFTSSIENTAVFIFRGFKY